ncbi:hypothetical protein BWZ22_02400 [Seonamhaeicola sp. S2-3]|uniref:hypothetical protein n=1 Tax=Seonamhaeicola sp. S2-3 TaxID=1936081 RepID=UPI0009729DE1|nr:hypothetical protein [Seonamhaeicola sp. S2-3]APY10153.1 hypothetical protein BWZ22_02400 [Seonamhaeicola sp. S2-3]
MNKNKENFILKIYSLTLTAVLAFVIFTSFKTNSKTEKLDEITVERINIVEPNGDLKMVISNKSKQHSGMFDGKLLFGKRERPAGIIFFNEEQDEVGGLLYQGNKKDGSSWILSVDQYKTDQIMQMRYLKNNDGKSRYGIQFWDKDENYTMPIIAKKIDSLQKTGLTMPQAINKIKKSKKGNPISAERMFIGKTMDEQAGVFIQDQMGLDRLKIYVDKQNNPRIEILDENGNVIKNLARD